MTSAINKRRSKRLDCFVPIEGKADGPFGATKTIDFSKGGLGFISRQKIPLNKEIPIELDLLNDDQPIIVMGKVVWVRSIAGTHQYRIGLEFNDFVQGSRSRLSKYFRQGHE